MSKKFKDTLRLSPAAQAYDLNKRYTLHPTGTPAYFDFWDEEKRRCLEGYTTPEGDITITGYHYFYLNYCRIRVAKKGEKHASRITTFPRFYDSDYDYFEAVDRARDNGEHLTVLKARRKGYSYKAGSMMCRNYFHIRHSKNFVFAGQKAYLSGADGILSKTFEIMNFVDANTAWTQPRLKDGPMEKTSGYKEKVKGQYVEKGMLSTIAGETLKDDPDKARGKAGELVFFEEAGAFPELLAAWSVALPTMRQGDTTLGLMVAFGTGGCLVGGSKVWNNKGELVNIEDLTPDQGIIGFDKGASKEPITYWQPPTAKQCVKLTTRSGRTLECSFDHPILKGIQLQTHSNIVRHVFTAAADLKVGDNIAVIEEVSIWSDIELEHARTIGWLIGDGTYGHNQTVRIANCEPEILEYLENNYECRTLVERPTKAGQTYKELRLRHVSKILRKIGIFGQTRLNKKLPNNIHGYSKSSVSDFIGGLFDTDGYISIRENQKRPGKKICEISISQASLELLKDLMLLLQKFGIHSKIRTRQPRASNPKDRNPWYELCIRDSRSLLVFSELITLFPKEKQKRLDLIKEYCSEVRSVMTHEGMRHETITSIINIGIHPVYNLTAGITHTYIGNGIITHNTEGDGFDSLNELFYNPAAYECMSFENVWSEANHGSTCGYFVPIYEILEGFIDDEGNSLIEEAKQFENTQREKRKKGNDPKAYDQYVAEHPMEPEEATLQVAGNLFNISGLKQQSDRVRANNLHTTMGIPITVTRGEKGYSYQPDYDLRPIHQFPHRKSDDLTGCVVMYERPYMKNNLVPDNLYFLCHDPYAHDKGASLGAAYVMKRPNNMSQPDDMIVASYVGRPPTQDEYNRNLFNLAGLYNARIGFENDRGDVIGYAKRYRMLHMLQPEFEFLENKELQSQRVKRGYGMHMTDGRKRQGELYLRDWMDSKRGRLLDDSYQLNMHKIYDLALLEELKRFNSKDGNFDRCLVEGTVILTGAGEVPIEQIEEGTKVLTHTGNYRAVTRTTQHLSEKLTDIYVVGQPNPLTCTSDHPVLVNFQNKRAGNRHWKYQERTGFKAAETLIPYRDFVLIPKRVSIPAPVTSEEAYIIGWYIGDGYLNRNTFSITFGKNEKLQADRVSEIINRLHLQHDAFRANTKSTCTVKFHGGYYKLTKTSRYVAGLFKKYGGTARNKKYELNCIHSAIGLLEAEGSLKTSPREAIEISMMPSHIIKHLRQVLIDHGVWSTYNVTKTGLHRLNIPSSYAQKLCSFTSMYAFESINVQNRNVVLETEYGFWTPVKQVDTREESRPVYNCEVEIDHTYVSNGFVTHNCMAMIVGMFMMQEMFNTEASPQNRTPHNDWFDNMYNGTPIFADDIPTDGISSI
jgi:intein/homing endonuclease